MNYQLKNKTIILARFGSILIATFAMLLICVHKAHAISGLNIYIPKISSPFASINGVTLNAEWLINQNIELKANIDSIYIVEIKQSIEDVSFSCKQASFDGIVFDCRNGSLSFDNTQFGKQNLKISFTYNTATSSFKSNFTDIKLFGGKQNLNIEVKNNDWQALFNGDFNSSALKSVINKYAPELDIQSAEGTFKVDAKATWDNSGKYNSDIQITTTDISIENSDSRSGIYQTGIETRVLIYGDSSVLEYDFHSVFHNAFVYYMHEISETELHYYSYKAVEPIIIDIIGSYGMNDGQLSVDTAVIKQLGIMDLDIDAQIEYMDKIDLQEVTLNINKLNLNKMLSQLEYPVVSFLDKEKLSLSGMVSASLTAKSPLSKQPLISSSIELNDVNYSYNQQALGINGLSGIINWNSQSDARSSTISWRGGNFQLIPFDASVLNFRLGADSLNVEKFKLPTLGGKIIVDSVSVQELGTNIEEFEYDLGINVKEIDLAELTTALQWPQMEGVINASFPRVTFADNMIELGGSAILNLFNGNMTLSNIAIEDPLGIVPRMRGDLEIEKLDLEELSSTLQFGRITGKLNGYARDIQLEQWFPVAMDMSLYTPDDDDTKRRISQKAVDFISDVGGVGGSLSRTYLRFFEEFSYNKIGINILLKDGTCNITGIEPAGQGYYIVKGSFIPRIDIVGYESQVSWVDLVEKIKGAIKSGPAVTN